jgi:diguanylate cyclase (GGDEF)-like protein/PAS domain S-box-containing protein
MADTDFDFDTMFFEDSAAADAAELTQRTLIDTQERMGMVLDLMPMGLIVHTRQGIIFANREACRLLEIGQPQAVGHHMLDFLGTGDIAPVLAQIEASFNDASTMHNRETTIVHADGSVVHIKLITCRLPWQGNPVIQMLLQDITEMKHIEQRLRRLTITDELTGAFNRRHAFYEAALYLDPARVPRIPLSAIMLDIDHFKAINDTHGHAAGDQALKALTKNMTRILTGAREADSAMFARIGGEEFVVLLPAVELGAAQALAERLRRAAAAIRIDSDTSSFCFTCSFGVGTYRDADIGFDGLLSRCDAALYEAKAAGRNCIKLAA